MFRNKEKFRYNEILEGVYMEKFTEKIFERATLKGITEYLLFGSDSKEEIKDYETRLEEAYLEYEKVVLQCDERQREELLDSANEMGSEIASVYAEIGIRVGMLLMKDIFVI